MRAKIKKQIKVIYGRQIQELEEKMNKYLQESEKEIGRIEVNEMNGGGRIGVIEEGEYVLATQPAATQLLAQSNSRLSQSEPKLSQSEPKLSQSNPRLAQSKPKLSTEEKMKEEYMSEVELDSIPEPISEPEQSVTHTDEQQSDPDKPTSSDPDTKTEKKPTQKRQPDRTVMEAMMYGLD